MTAMASIRQQYLALSRIDQDYFNLFQYMPHSLLLSLASKCGIQFQHNDNMNECIIARYKENVGEVEPGGK